MNLKKIFFLIFLFLTNGISYSAGLFPEEFKLCNNLQITIYNQQTEKFHISKSADKIYYEFDDSIWMMDTSGKNKKKLIEGTSPSVSADNNTLAYKYGDSIYLLDLGTLQDTGKIDDVIEARFSPDSNMLAYISTKNSPYNIFVYNFSNNTNNQITDIEEERSIVNFYFIPEQEKIVYSTAEFDPIMSSLKPNTTNLSIVDIDGIIRYNLFKNLNIVYFSISDDGKKIAYVDSLNNIKIMDIHTEKTIFICKSDEFIFPSGEVWFPTVIFKSNSKELFLSLYNKKAKKFYISVYKTDGIKIANLVETSLPVWNIQLFDDKIIYTCSKNINSVSPKAIFCANFIRIFINNEKINFTFYPVKIKNEIFIPISDVEKKLSLVTKFNRAKRALYIKYQDINLEYQLNMFQMLVNDEIVDLSIPPFTISNKIYIPIKSLTRALHFDTVYDEDRETIYITYP